MTDTFETPFGAVQLTCDTIPSRSPTQAWNQADAYILNKVYEDYGAALADKTVAIVNDQYGALSCALDAFNPEIYSDSAIFKRWLSINRQGIATKVYPIESIRDSTADLFLVKLPKNLHFFQHLLSLISNKPHVVAYVAGMQKYWPRSFFQAAGDCFAEMTVFPGVRKAKCTRLTEVKDAPQVELTRTIHMEALGFSCVNYPNVFSREQLDIGARFFLENAPDLTQAKRVMDLACGNGVLGLQTLLQYPNCRVHFVDESDYAIRSCAASLTTNQIDLERVTLHHNDGLFDLDLSGCDAILCNPPFHQEHQVSSHVADLLIQQSYLALRPGGSLYLLANRHLQHGRQLRRFFNPVRQIASNDKFVLYHAMRDETETQTQPVLSRQSVDKPDKRPDHAARSQRRRKPGAPTP